MSSRRHSPVAIERRVRRIAVRQGFDMLTAQKPDAKVLAHGGYMLRETESGKIVFGEERYRFSASLEDVEEFLLKRDGGEAPE